VADVVLTASTNDTDMSSSPGRIWIVSSQAGVDMMEADLLLDPGIHPIPGYHLFGLMELTQHDTIGTSFTGFLGGREVHHLINVTNC
jgi:hypothetical protein